MYSFSAQQIDIIQSCPLFANIEINELQHLLAALPLSVREYRKGSYIYTAGEKNPSLGLVLEGRAYIEYSDAWGASSIIDAVGPGQIFAETYACIPDAALLVNVYTAAPAEILFLDMRKLIAQADDDPLGRKLIRNLLTISSEKNLILSRRMIHTSSKSIRDRVISYLSFQAVQSGCDEFRIPFDRQQLADYLNVDRSALSAELGRMQREGLIQFCKNKFKLIHEV